MPELVRKLIVGLDGFARGRQSPGYHGCLGPDFAEWISTNAAAPHRQLFGRRTYQVLNAPREDLRDEGCREG